MHFFASNGADAQNRRRDGQLQFYDLFALDQLFAQAHQTIKSGQKYLPEISVRDV